MQSQRDRAHVYRDRADRHIAPDRVRKHISPDRARPGISSDSVHHLRASMVSSHCAAALIFLTLLIASPAGCAGNSTDWDALWLGVQNAETAVLTARIEGDPQATYAAENLYAAKLAEASAALTLRDPGKLPAGEPVAGVVTRLLISRDVPARKWLDQHRADLKRLDANGALTFWTGFLAFDDEDWQTARACLAADVPEALRPVRDVLLIRALDRIDQAAAISHARKSLEMPQHPFRDEITLYAARVAIEGGDSSGIQLLESWLPFTPLASSARAAGETLLAEAARSAGRAEECRAHFDAAGAAGNDFLGARDLRLAQAQWIVVTCNRLPSNELADCILAVSRLGGASEGLRMWDASAAGLSPDDSITVSREILNALHRERASDLTLRLAREIARSKQKHLQRLAALMRARVYRRDGHLAGLRKEYRKAAGADGASFASWEAEIAAPALWELARELEDARVWAAAADTYAELVRRFPEDPQSREAALREAFCLHHGGRKAESLALLRSLCANARPEQVAAPCLWLALWTDEASSQSLLAKAAGERNPGYNALRAATESSLGQSGVGFWRALSAEIRSSASWRWPQSLSADSARTVRLLALAQQNDVALAGRVFLSQGRADLARTLWRTLPGWTDLTSEERSALQRAFGDDSESIRTAIATGERHDRYPVVHPVEVDGAAQRFGFSPAFILAVMRQESLFDRAAISAAGAHGLMQLMPATAEQTADHLALPDYDLEDPSANIQLGVCHLAELFDSSGNAVPLALAAYNAGWQKARNWQRAGQTWDEYIESIPYTETRRFVKNVLMHYWFYRHCYRSASESGGNSDCMCD